VLRCRWRQGSLGRGIGSCGGVAVDGHRFVPTGGKCLPNWVATNLPTVRVGALSPGASPLCRRSLVRAGSCPGRLSPRRQRNPELPPRSGSGADVRTLSCTAGRGIGDAPSGRDRGTGRQKVPGWRATHCPEIKLRASGAAVPAGGLAPCFTQPTFQTFSMLLVGMIGRIRDCTITGMLQACGLAGVWHHGRAHDFFARRRWNPDELGLRLLDFLVVVFAKTARSVSRSTTPSSAAPASGCSGRTICTTARSRRVPGAAPAGGTAGSWSRHVSVAERSRCRCCPPIRAQGRRSSRPGPPAGAGQGAHRHGDQTVPAPDDRAGDRRRLRQQGVGAGCPGG
jgi:hypothetical protein